MKEVYVVPETLPAILPKPALITYIRNPAFGPDRMRSCLFRVSNYKFISYG